MRAFEVPAYGIRGALLGLGAAWREVRARGADGVDAASRAALGEALACTALLAGALGLRATVSLQVRRHGAPGLLFAECTEAGTLRGLVRPGDGLADAVLALTIERAGRRQQAQVPFERDGVAAALAAHFARSENLPTQWRIALDDERAAAILVQQSSAPEDEAGAALALAALGDAALHESAEALLGQVFGDADVRLYPERPLRFACSCSRERVLAALRGIDPEELEGAPGAALEVACECCGARYAVERAALSAGPADERHQRAP